MSQKSASAFVLYPFVIEFYRLPVDRVVGGGNVKEKRYRFHGIPWIAIPVIVFLLSCSAEKTEKPVMSVPVTVSTVLQKTIPVQLRAIGNVQAYSTVSIKSQVGGELTRVHFAEGQDVKKGRSGLKRPKTNLARDIAQIAQAKAISATTGEAG
jgi:multidrug efflux system membrane fusion protein